MALNIYTNAYFCYCGDKRSLCFRELGKQVSIFHTPHAGQLNSCCERVEYL